MPHPVEQAILPLKADAIKRAQTEARALLDKIMTDLAAHNWDVNAAAPRPNGNMGREQYRRMHSKHALYLSVTAYAPDQTSRRLNDPHYRQPSPDHEARFVKGACEDAAIQYDAFVAKLVGKIGACDSAALAGSHVWGHSILTVLKADGIVERWKTQQIVNQSKLGTLFNQWPSRKLK